MTVNVYRSTDPNAPVLNGQSGSLVTVLNACLVAGYPGKTPAGWTKPFTNSTTGAVFRQGSGSNGFYLNVDDTGVPSGANFANVKLFETMTAWSNTANPFPGTNPTPSEGMINAGASQWTKSNTADATVRPWIIIATERGFHIVINYNSSTAFAPVTPAYYYFGDIISASPVPDPYATVITSNATLGNITNSNFTVAMNNSGQASRFLARSITQLGSGIYFYAVSDIVKSAGMSYPNLADGMLWVSPYTIIEDYIVVNSVRGTMPGVYYPAFLAAIAIPDFIEGQQVIVTSGDLAGKTLECHWATAPSGSPAILFLEISNTY